MPRHTPAASGIRSAARTRATAQNGSSWHVLALLDSSSESRIECGSGLLIRGFGVQVPGGAPVLTWGFTTPGHFYMSGLSGFCSDARSLLAQRSDVGAGWACLVWADWSRPAIGTLSDLVTQRDIGRQQTRK